MTERTETSPQQAMTSLLLAARVDPTLRAWAQVADKGLTDALAEIDALRSELEAMRPVVEAAEGWATTYKSPRSRDETRASRIALGEAVYGYLARSVRNGE